MRLVFGLIAAILALAAWSLFWPVSVQSHSVQDAEEAGVASSGLAASTVGRPYAEYSSITNRSLFNPARKVVKVMQRIDALETTPVVEEAGVSVMGVIIAPKVSQVILQTSPSDSTPWLKVGDEFGELTVLEIDRNIVRVDHDGTEIRLTVGVNLADN